MNGFRRGSILCIMCEQDEAARIYDGPISPVQTLKHARVLEQRHEHSGVSRWFVVSIYLHATDYIRKIRESISEDQQGQHSYQMTLPSAARTPLTSGAP